MSDQRNLLIVPGSAAFTPRAPLAQSRQSILIGSLQSPADEFAAKAPAIIVAVNPAAAPAAA